MIKMLVYCDHCAALFMIYVESSVVSTKIKATSHRIHTHYVDIFVDRFARTK